MTETLEISRKARHIWDVVEPVAACVYFAPEAHAAYEELGYEGSRLTNNGIAFPDRVAYFISRGACMGKVPGEVVAAAFGVFKREAVVALVEEGWGICPDPEPVLAARERGAAACLSRVLGESPDGLGRATDLLGRAAEAAPGEGRHLFSGLQSLGLPGTPVADLWRAADLVREHRGDSHIAAWTAHGFDACEIGVITDVWRGQPLKSWVRSRAWTDEELDAAVERLRSSGLLAGESITEQGWQAREDVDTTTDTMEARLVDALGDDIDELFSIMEPIAARVVDQRAYPGAVSWGRPPSG